MHTPTAFILHCATPFPLFYLSRPPRTPLRYLSRPLTTRSHTLSKRILLSLFRAFSTSPSFSLSTSLFFLRYSRCIFALLLQTATELALLLPPTAIRDKVAWAFFLAIHLSSFRVNIPIVPLIQRTIARYIMSARQFKYFQSFCFGPFVAHFQNAISNKSSCTSKK